MSQPEVTMVVVSWNVRDSLRRCLVAALASQGVKSTVVVVDNASSDGSAAMVAKEFPHVLLRCNRENRGFAAAVNQGIGGASGHVLLLNPDLEIDPQAALKMVRALETFPEVGIIGPRVLYPNGNLQPSVKRFPRWIDLFFVLLKLPNLWPSVAARYQALDFNYSKTQMADQVMGSCFFIRSETRQEVGAFDEKFWIWYEEVDWCLRARQLGWRTLYLAEAEAIHGRGQSFRLLTTRKKQSWLRQSIGHYVRKHFGVLFWIGLWPGFLASWTAAWLIDSIGIQKPTAARHY